MRNKDIREKLRTAIPMILGIIGFSAISAGVGILTGLAGGLIAVGISCFAMAYWFNEE